MNNPKLLATLSASALAVLIVLFIASWWVDADSSDSFAPLGFLILITASLLALAVFGIIGSVAAVIITYRKVYQFVERRRAARRAAQNQRLREAKMREQKAQWEADRVKLDKMFDDTDQSL